MATKKTNKKTKQNTNKIKYKTNITLSLPCEKLLTEGTSNKEITDMSGIVFKRIK